VSEEALEERIYIVFNSFHFPVLVIVMDSHDVDSRSHHDVGARLGVDDSNDHHHRKRHLESLERWNVNGYGRKRLRRDPSAPSIAVVSFDEKEEEASGLGGGNNNDNADTPDVSVPGEDDESLVIQKELDQAVALIEASKPVGSKKYLAAVHRLRHILSTYEEPPYMAAVRAGAVPVLIEALQPPHMDSTALETTFQASWALTNLAVGTSEVIKAIIPAAPILIAHISSPPHGGFAMAEQCAWAIGNMGEDEVKYRAILIANGAVKPLAALFIRAWNRNSQIISPSKKPGGSVSKGTSSLDLEALSAAETAAWALSILFKGEGEEVCSFLEMEGAMDAAIGVLMSSVEEDLHEVGIFGLVREVAWLLARVTSAYPSKISVDKRTAILDAAAMQLRLVYDNCNPEYLEKTLIPILRVISNLAFHAGKEVCAYFKEDAGCDLIDLILMCGSQKNKYGLEMQVGETLKHIARVEKEAASFVKRNTMTIPLMKKYLKEEPFHVKKESVGVLLALCESEDDPSEILNHLFTGDEGSVKNMLLMLHAADENSVSMGLEFTDMMVSCLSQGKDVIEHAGGLELLEDMRTRSDVSNELKEQTEKLLQKHWSINT
jgi:hypothetical protein